MAALVILETNCLEVAPFFMADVVYRGGRIPAATDSVAVVAGAIAMVVTAVPARPARAGTPHGWRMGSDSPAVLIAYAAGLVGLYWLRFP